MTAEDMNWNSRLCVSYKPAGGASSIVHPINNMELNEEDTVDIIDSIDAHNLGYSFGNPRYSFSFEVKAVNMKVFRQIYSSFRKRTRFSVGMGVVTGLSDDWYLDSVEITNCMITNVSQTVDNTGGVPTLKYQAVALDVSVSNDGAVLTTNHTGGGSGSLT